MFNYQNAIENDLPIGSGEVESGHRSVVQKRMKLSEAWWREDNAEVILTLHTIRASGDWENYWKPQPSLAVTVN